MEGALQAQDYFIGNRFTAADIQLSFVLDAGAQRGGLGLKARPAYQRALEKGGPYELRR
jgi:glutathione S-transferase